MISRLQGPTRQLVKRAIVDSRGRLAPLIGQASTEQQFSQRFASGTIADDYWSKTQQQKSFSSMAVDDDEDHFGPMGELFELTRGHEVNQDLVGKTASIRRVFGPNANAQGLLICGGEELARHASFDLDYKRARGWIQNRAIGPAVLSPVIISGMVGALVEAAFPQSVPVTSAMHQARPLIVGQEVLASVQVIGVKHFDRNGEEVSTKAKDFGSHQDGHEIKLMTEVVRTQDNEIISEGSHTVWIPGYLSRNVK